MPTINRDASGRFSRVTLNVNTGTFAFATDTTEITTMPTTFAPTPAFASILSGIETRVSTRADALVEESVSALVRDTVHDTLLTRVAEATADLRLRDLLREEATTTAREAAASFLRDEAPVIRDSVIEQAITGFSVDTHSVAAHVAERMMQDHLSTVVERATERLMADYYYDGSIRLDRLERFAIDRLVDRLHLLGTADDIANRVAEKLADKFAGAVAERLFGDTPAATADTASAAPEGA